jgi:internalin A
MDEQALANYFKEASKTRKDDIWLFSQEISSLPPEIGLISNVKRIYLDKNQLTTLPPEIGQLSNLEYLELHSNKITSLPAEIGNLTNLRTLDLRGNELESLPAEIGNLTNLETLDLGGNELESLPLEICRLTNLETLDLRGNNLPIPPEILGKSGWGREPGNPAAILSYYSDLLSSQQKKSLNEVKVILVGQGDVGKTSLIKCLKGETFDPRERITHGIKIHQWQVPVNSQEIRLNLWDFGGQEIMHATHQFFLTKRSIYLLVLKNRQTEEENRLEYWLNIINSFGGGSPVLIIGNQADQHPLDINKQALTAKYPNIKGFIQTSCETGEGIDTLKATLIREISTLAHVHDPLPLTWFTLKQQLEQLEQDYIPYTEYEKLCQAEGITEALSQTTLIGFLHDLGVVLNFDDDRLRDTSVLKPAWVTNGIYKILNDHTLIVEHRGILDRIDLSRILDPGRYPRPLLIMDMMKRFELCFAIEPDRQWLIPDLLPKEEPDTGNWGGALAFQYHYNILPQSIISRFIVKMHLFISCKTYWRTGVVLDSGEGNRARIRADLYDKKIFIDVDGNLSTRRAFLTTVRSRFSEIHSTIVKLEPKEKVPLPQAPHIVVDYQLLLTHERKKVLTLIPEGYEDAIDVKSLLDGIESSAARRSHGNEQLVVNIDNRNNQVSTMSNDKTWNGDRIEGDKFGGDKVMGNKMQAGIVQGDAIAGNKLVISQNLAQAAQDIKALITQLSSNYDTSTQSGKMGLSAKVLEAVEANPTVKSRVINALKAAGSTALEEAIDHPVAKVLVAGVKGFIDRE